MSFPAHGWPVYAHPAKEYPEEDYYYGSQQYPYAAAAAPRYEPVYGRIPHPYYYDPYEHYEEDPARQDERVAALPVGQETWYENEEPHWKPEDLDDVNAAFLDNLILTQMARDAQRRRENTRAADYEERDSEDEDVRELKALAGKPLYHVPKTSPHIDEDEDYAADDAFINWNGNKRSAPVGEVTTRAPRGQDEIAVPPEPRHPRPADHPTATPTTSHEKRDSSLYRTIAHMLAAEKTNQNQVSIY